MERLPIVEDDRETSHLAVLLEEPGASRPAAAVLYLHGFGASQAGDKVAFFRRRFLERGLAFCSFDFQGHGDSGGDLGDLTMSRNLADAGRVHGHLRRHGYERVVLFGSSMGGATALWHAALHPEGVAGAVAISPALAMDESLAARIGPQAMRRWQRRGRHRFESDLVSCDLGFGLIEDLRTYGLRRLAELYRTPALIFQGKHDESVDWRGIVDFVTGCRFEEIELLLIADGDHRLVGRLEHLWRLTASFLEARGIA